MGFKKGRKKTVRRLLRLAALFKAQSVLSSTAGPTANTRPSAVVSEPSRGHCLPHGGRSINRRKTEHQQLPWSLSHLEAVACHCVQGMAVDPLTRERQNIRALLKGISFYSYFYQHAMSLPGLRCSTSCRMFFFMMSYVLRLLMFQSPPSNTAKTLADMDSPNAF